VCSSADDKILPAEYVHGARQNENHDFEKGRKVDHLLHLQNKQFQVFYAEDLALIALETGFVYFYEPWGRKIMAFYKVRKKALNKTRKMTEIIE